MTVAVWIIVVLLVVILREVWLTHRWVREQAKNDAKIAVAQSKRDELLLKAVKELRDDDDGPAAVGVRRRPPRPSQGGRV